MGLFKCLFKIIILYYKYSNHKKSSFINSCFFILLGCQSNKDKNLKSAIDVSFSNRISTKNLDGRLLLMLSNNIEKEPVFKLEV